MVTETEKQLIAPCGINCAYCVGYLIYEKGLNRRGYRGCKGCRPREKQCAFLKKRCDLLLNKKVDFCYECPDFPCDNLKKLDKQYQRKNWDVSFSGNNERIKEVGLDEFIGEQKEKFKCPQCGGKVCIHTGKCADCCPESLLK